MFTTTSIFREALRWSWAYFRLQYRLIFSSLVDDSRHRAKRERRQNYCQMSYPCIPDNLFISDLILHSTLTSLRNTRQNPSNQLVHQRTAPLNLEHWGQREIGDIGLFITQVPNVL